MTARMEQLLKGSSVDSINIHVSARVNTHPNVRVLKMSQGCLHMLIMAVIQTAAA